MVPALLTMKAGMDTILAESFAKNDSFVMALKEAFEHFINQRQNKCVPVANLRPRARQSECCRHAWAFMLPPFSGTAHNLGEMDLLMRLFVLVMLEAPQGQHFRRRFCRASMLRTCIECETGIMMSRQTVGLSKHAIGAAASHVRPHFLISAGHALSGQRS